MQEREQASSAPEQEPRKLTRVILKVSGEAFGTDDKHIDLIRYSEMAKQLIEIQNKTGIQLAIVVGGGNIFRGREAEGEIGLKFDPIDADHMGMFATMMNGIALRRALIDNGAVGARLMTAISVPQVAEEYIRYKALSHLSKGLLVVIAGGLGVTRFSTDSAVAHYAEELGCQMIFKASTVDGVYDCDPKKNSGAKKYQELSYQDALSQGLNVMDPTAFTMGQGSGIPIFVFDINRLCDLPAIIEGDYSFGTLISGK